MEGCSNGEDVSPKELKESCCILKEQMCRSENAGNPVQLVQFAEYAAKGGHADIAVECLQLYFSLSPPVNQFLIRAYLCKALISFPLNCLERAKLLEATQHIQTAVNIAVKFECYHFLVYNASVILWKLCRPFQKPGYQKLCVKPLQNMVKALEEIGEQDCPWRMELLMGLVVGHLDAGLKEEATKALSAAIQLARKDVPNQLVNLFKFQMQYQLGDPKSWEKEVKTSPELNTWNKLYKLRSLQTPDLKQKIKALLADIISGTEQLGSGPQPSLSSHSQAMLLADLAELSKKQGYSDLAVECANKLPPDPKYQVIRELIIAEQACTTEVLYTKQAVEVRLKAIKRVEEGLTSATRIGDPDLVQRSCVLLWNLSLPLLQHNLCHHLLKPFKAASSALQNIDSLLHSLRCCIHFELAKVMADDGQLQSALDHTQKALLLDYAGDYTEQLNHFQSRLVLRAQLFDTPQTSLDKAAKIVEQVGSNPGLGDVSALLIQAGDLMAPNCFLHIVSSCDVTQSGSGFQLESNGKRLQLYEQALQKVVDHAKAVGTDFDKERCYLWSDLVKTARKAGVWSVAMAAAKLCLLYDDGRWSSATSTRKHSSHAFSLEAIQQRASTLSRVTSSALDSAASNLQQVALMSDGSKTKAERDLVRTLANIHCLHAEALIYLLQLDGLKLGVLPKLPDKHWHGDKDPASTQDAHQKYCNWVLELTNDAKRSFLKAAELGASLQEPWLVYNAATYLWNHSRHLVEGGNFVDLVEVLRALLPHLKQVQLQFNPELFSHISAVLARGIVQRWMPVVPEPSLDTTSSSVKKKAGRGSTPKKGKSTGEVQIDPEANSHIKEALEVCEAAMNVAHSGVGLHVRWQLLSAWVQCKQLLQQPVPRDTLGHENQADPHLSHCRAIVATEMIEKLGNGIWDFPSCPTLNEVYDLIKSTSPWEDRDIELELLTKLTSIAVTQKEYEMAMKLAEAAVQLETRDQANPDQTQKNAHPSNSTAECELLSHACCLLGQCLESTASGSHLQVEKAIEAYFKSARFGYQAKNYSLLIKACQHYWNACLPVASCSPDRAALQKPLSQLLNFLESFNAKKGYQGTGHSQGAAPVSKDLSQSYDLQVTMYGLVFEIYFDKSLWKEGLKAIEEAMQRTPKEIHRRLMQHKLVFKSKVGRSVEAEMVHFQDEPEETRASLWYKVARNATDKQEQAKAFQEAITTLKSPVNSSLKIQYLIEFGQWLYNNDRPPEEAIEQLQLAVMLLQHDMDVAQTAKTDIPPSGHEATGSDVSKLDSCMQVYAMLAQIEGVATKKGLDYTLLSLGCCMRMWKSTFSCLGNSGSSSVKGKPSVPSWPITPQDWASFSLSEELKALIKDGKGSAAFNSCTIQKPSLSVHYLGLLAGDLSKASLHPLSIPLLVLQLSIAECIIQCPPLVSLIHRKIAALCLKLGLKSATSHHIELAGVTMNAEDIARMRAEAVQFRAKREGGFDQRKEQEGSTHQLYPTQDFLIADHVWVCPDVIPSREVWLQQAQLLTEQGQYQPARELLDESCLSCEMYQDRQTLGRVVLAQACLAAIEKNYVQASELLQRLQKLPLTALVWLESVLLLCEVLSHVGTDLMQTEAVVKHSLDILSGRQRKNETHFVGYAKAKLRAKYAILSISKLEGSSLLDQCQTLSECADHLAQMGHQYEATELWTIEANTLKCVGLTMRGKGHYKQILLKALDSYRKSRCTLQTLLDVALDLCKPSEALSLPVQCQLVSSLLDEARLLTAIFEDHTHIERDLWNKRRQKSSVEKLIEEYVTDMADRCEEHQVWSDTSRSAKEQAMSLLVSAHSLAREEKSRSQCAYALGHFLLLYSEHTSPYGALQWRSWEIKEGTGEEDRGHLSALSIVMRKDEAQKEEAREALSLQYMAQATQSLAQAVSLALQCGDLEVAKEAAFRLVEGFGCHGAINAAQYLALYQSCAVSLEFRSLLSLVHPSPYHTELGALLLQHTHLGTHTSHGPTTDANSQRLQQYECWKRLAVSSGHLDLLRSFPSHFRCILLQHSPDKTRLYAAYLIPPQPPPPAPKKGQTPVPTEVIEPVVCCVSVNPQVLHSLLELVADFKKELSAALLKEQSSNIQGGQGTSSMQGGQGTSSVQGGQGTSSVQGGQGTSSVQGGQGTSSVQGGQGTSSVQGGQGTSSVQGGQEAHSMCVDIITATEEYLSEATRPISTVLQREGVDNKLAIVLLADTYLMQLPLEALTFLHSTNILTVCRDFSLQILHHRIAKFQSESDSTEEATKDKKKTDKYVAIPPTVMADLANFKYILDPRNDAKSSSHGLSPVLEVTETFQSFPKLTSKWIGLKGSDHVISSGEWPSLLRGCSGLIFFGYERFLAHFSAAKLTSLNLSGCSVVLLMDQMQTKASTLLQSREDLGRSESELQLEQYLYTMIFLTLTGVGCTVANQWCCTVRSNLSFTKAMVKGLLSESRSVGELAWGTRHCPEPDKTAPSVGTGAEIDHISADNPPQAPPLPVEDVVVKYASVVYGLPHIALVAPSA